MYLSGIDDYPELDLQEMIDRAFDNYPDEFREYWHLDDKEPPEELEDEQWERFKDHDRLARKVAGLAACLVRPQRLRDHDLATPIRLREQATESESSFKKIIELVREKYPNDAQLISSLSEIRVYEQIEYKFFRAALQLYLAEYLIWPKDLADRVIELTKFAVRVKNPRARQYLGRVSRCYIYGMTPELAVMGRATVEVVLEDLLPEEQVRTISGLPANARVGLQAYIQLADGTVLTKEAAAAARRLKERGDDAVHVTTELTVDADEVIRDLVEVLMCYERRTSD